MIDKKEVINSYISFKNSKPMEEFDNVITLEEWLKTQQNNFEFNKVGNKESLKKSVYQGLNQKLDIKTEYIHKQEYFIESYSPKDIYMTPEQEIIYSKIEKMPDSLSEQEKLKIDNLNKQALLCLGIYADCLNQLKASFVKDNFEAFTIFLPPEDVPYYKGIIERGATVYYNEFTRARAERELTKYTDDLESNEKNSSPSPSNSNNRGLVKSTAAGRAFAEENENKSAAFVSLYFYLILGIVSLGSMVLLILGKIFK